jgi:hypothetical protein
MNQRRVGRALLQPLLSGLLLCLLWHCGKGPTKVDVKKANEPPETYISATGLSKVPLETDTTGAVINLSEFSFTVEYTGVDVDGKVDSFAIRVDGGPWSAWTEKRKSTGTANFASVDDAHTVEVKARDNEGTEDPSPAKATLSLAQVTANKPPTTGITSGPANGATTSPGVRFEVSGTDEDGKVANFLYTVDGGNPLTLPADANGRAVIEFGSATGNSLSAGNHTLSVTSVDNLGAKDPTPETRSFFVGSGFKPIMALTSTVGPPSAAGGWFTGVNVPFAWSVSTAHYFGIVDHFEFSVDEPNPANFTSTKLLQASLVPQSAGSHTFRVRAVDTAGNISDILQVNFEVTQFAPTEGILFIDNVNENPSTTAYANEPDMDQKILNGFFKNFTRVSVWDVDRLSGSERFSGAINTKALPGPADLAKYSSVVIMTDATYSASTISTLLAAYFQAGGNLLVTGFRTVNFAQALKDAMATPTVLTARGTNFQSLEGFQTGSSDNSNAYAFISGADIVPVVPGAAARDWERMNNVRGTSFRILFANVGAGGAQSGDRIALETQGAKGNWGIWLGMSLYYLDQNSAGIVKLGDFILGNRFKER